MNKPQKPYGQMNDLNLAACKLSCRCVRKFLMTYRIISKKLIIWFLAFLSHRKMFTYRVNLGG